MNGARPTLLAMLCVLNLGAQSDGTPLAADDVDYTIEVLVRNAAPSMLRPQVFRNRLWIEPSK